jgi:hypothetical protein
MKPLVVLLALACTTAFAAKEPAKKTAHATDPNTPAVKPATGPACDASIHELIGITGAMREFTDSLAQCEVQLKQATIGTTDPYGMPLNPPQKAAIERCKTNVGALIQKELAWTKLEPQVLRFYREHYTQEQLDGVLAFLKSPTGKAFLTNEREINTKVMESLIRPVLEKVGLHLFALVTDLRDNSDFIRPDQRGQ